MIMEEINTFYEMILSVRINEGISEKFEVKEGLRQGDPLFNLILFSCIFD